MAYSTAVDLKNYMPEAQLLQLTDDNDVDSIDVEKLDDAIRRADDLIDGYLRGRYELPLPTVPSLIQDLSTRLAVYFLYKRALYVMMPESVKDEYKDSSGVLEKIQKGKISPFATSKEPIFFKSSKAASDRIWTTQPTNTSYTPPVSTGAMTNGQLDWNKFPI